MVCSVIWHKYHECHSKIVCNFTNRLTMPYTVQFAASLLILAREISGNLSAIFFKSKKNNGCHDDFEIPLLKA